MLFKDLAVGDVFKLITGDTTFIKLSAVNDNEYPFRRYYNYPSNVLIIDKLHYGVISPMAEVYRIKEYHGKEQEKTSLKELLEKHKSDIHKQNFMTYGGVPYDKISKDALYYTEADVKNTMAFLGLCQEYQKVAFPGVKKVIFNKPATIVLWGDGTKTVVKCQNDEQFDPEKGLALCFMKKALGNKSNFNNVIHKWVKDEEPKAVRSTSVYPAPIEKVAKAKKMANRRTGRKTAKATTSDTNKSDKKTVGKKKLEHFTKSQIRDIRNYILDDEDKHFANIAGISIATLNKALRGESVTRRTISKICDAMGWGVEF